MAFPSYDPQYGVKETTIGKTITSSFDGNYVQQRKSTTRMRKRFEMTYLLNQSEYETLDAFFSSNIGGSFTFTHPATTTAYTVRFVDDKLEATHVYNNIIQVSVTLEEV